MIEWRDFRDGGSAAWLNGVWIGSVLQKVDKVHGRGWFLNGQKDHLCESIIEGKEQLETALKEWLSTDWNLTAESGAFV